MANLNKNLILFIILIGVFYLLALNSNLSTVGDNALFISLSKSIVYNYEYSFFHLPTPVPEIHWPFIFPLLLIPIIYLFGVNIVLLKLIPLLFAILSIIIFYFIVKEREDPKLTMIILALIAVNPLMFFFSHEILSEITYLFFSLCTLYFINKYDKTKFVSNKYLFLTTIFLLLTYFTRAIGISLIIAIGLYYLVKIVRKNDIGLNFKKLISIIILITIPIIAWLIRTLKYKDVAAIPSTLSQALYVNPTNPELGIIGIKGFISRILENIYYYLGPGIINDINKILPNNLNKLIILLIIIGGIYWFITGWGLIKSYKQHKSVFEYYFLIYLILILIYPWTTIRFLVPIIPFLVYYFIIGIKEITQKINAKRFFTAIILILFLISVFACGFELKRQHETPFYKGDWMDFYEASLWIRDNSQEDTVIMSKRDALVHLWTERKTTSPPYTSNQTKVMDVIKDNNINYIIIDSFEWTTVTKNFLVPFVEKNKDKLIEVHRINNTIIYEITSYSYQQENQI